jgi:hypothetical protein
VFDYQQQCITSLVHTRSQQLRKSCTFTNSADVVVLTGKKDLCSLVEVANPDADTQSRSVSHQTSSSEEDTDHDMVAGTSYDDRASNRQYGQAIKWR